MSKDNEEAGVWRYINGHPVFIKNKVPADALKTAIKEHYAAAQGKKPSEKKLKDIMNEWRVSPNPSNKPQELAAIGEVYELDGMEYLVDGKYVKYDYDKTEQTIAERLADTYNKKVFYVPKIDKPDGVKSPDYFIGDERAKYDLKTIEGNSRRTLKSAISHKKKQAPNFILNISKKSYLSDGELKQQITGLYSSKDTAFVKNIVVIRNGKVIMAYRRIRIDGEKK